MASGFPSLVGETSNERMVSIIHGLPCVRACLADDALWAWRFECADADAGQDAASEV